MYILTARGARGLVDRRYGRLGGGFFGVVDDADNVLPPVDVIRERRLAEIAGLALGVVDRDEYLKKQRAHRRQSTIYIYDKRNLGELRIDHLSVDRMCITSFSTHRCPLERGSDQRRDGHQAQDFPHGWILCLYIIRRFLKTRRVTVYNNMRRKI